MLDLEGASDKVIADFSLGMTERIGLAEAVLHPPRVLVLDEPFGPATPPCKTDMAAVSTTELSRDVLAWIATRSRWPHAHPIA